MISKVKRTNGGRRENGRRLPLRRPIWPQVLTPRGRMFTGEVNIPDYLWQPLKLQDFCWQGPCRSR